MTTQVIKEGNVTTTIMDLTNGVGGRTTEVNITQRIWLFTKTSSGMHLTN